MDGHLLFVVLMYSFQKIQTQALLPPKLTVNPSMITETDSVTLNCQTPPSVSMSRCYFYTVSGRTIRVFSCLKTLTGTELLEMSHQRSPAEVKVTCFYTVNVGEKKSSSLHSNTTSITVQSSLPPKLTVNPPVIKETDSVTLNCQTPPSVSVSQCYFYTVKGGAVKRSSCLKTLTGTELLEMSHQSSPAEVEVTCFYTVKLGETDSPSPHSETSSITVQSSLPPKLTVNPPVIKETDSVTLNCQTPPSVSVSQCYFYTVKGGAVKRSSCLKTLTGTELLEMSHQSSPAEVEVTCFYTVKLGETDSPSPHSETSSITVHSQKPQMSLQHFHGDHVLFSCSLPGSANHDTRCHLYFGEASGPVATRTVQRKPTTKTKQWFCQFTVTVADLLTRLRLVEPSEASCDYSLGNEVNSLSPRSDGYSLTDIVERESSMTKTTPTLRMTTGLTVSRSGTSTHVTLTSGRPVDQPSHSGGSTSAFLTPVKPTSGSSVSFPAIKDRATPVKTASETWIWKFVVVVAGCGVTVGVIVLVSAIYGIKRRAGSEEVKKQELHSDTYHLYSTISEDPAASALKDMVYNTVQAH